MNISHGGTVFLYSGSAAMVQVGDATYASDTQGFHLDNVVVNTTSSAAATAQAVKVWRAQEVHLESLYLLGNSNQTGITLDGTGNYTGGTFQDIEIGGFQTALNAIGHQVANARVLQGAGAARLVADEDFDADALVAAADLLADEGTLAAMSIAARGFGRPGAAAAVAELVLAAAERRPLPEPTEIERISRGMAG